MTGGGNLKLQKLFLENFRGIKELVIDLSGENTVFYGINGVGKSSILRGVSLLFQILLPEFQKARFGSS